jgi:hypothetical protein
MASSKLSGTRKEEMSEKSIGGDGSWLVLVRDVSESIRVEAEPALAACLVLEMETGLVRGVSVGAFEEEAIERALTMGFTSPAGGLRPGRPTGLLCQPQLESLLRHVLPRIAAGGPLPPVSPIEPPGEADDVFDSFIGHMAGRPQPDHPPTPSDWALLYRHALAFYRAAPWTRWHDGVVLRLEIEVDSAQKRYAAVIMGNAGIQHGLVLYPGNGIPPGLKAWKPGRPIPNPRGTLAVMLDSPPQVPVDLFNKAIRYGWPPDADLAPVALRFGREDAGDPDATECRLMAVALAAVSAHDARGPIAVDPGGQATTGETVFEDGSRARFSVTQEPPRPEPTGPRFRAYEAGFDLVPEGTPVVLGHLSWEAVNVLRTQARIHRPFPSGAPRPSGAEVPLLAILPKPKNGDWTAAKVAELDPYGVVATPTGDGEEVFVLAGGEGAEVLMEVQIGTPGLGDFHRRMRATKGLHVVMVADEGSSRGEGAVYGLFECYQPPRKAPSGTRKPNGKKKNKGGK